MPAPHLTPRPCLQRLILTTTAAAAMVAGPLVVPAAAEPPAAPAATVDRYVYSIPTDGPVHVTVRPRQSGPFSLPVTAEGLTGHDVRITENRSWELFTSTVDVVITGPEPVLTYDWPEGAIPWPVKVSNWLPQTDMRWSADAFHVAGPAEVTFVLPPGTRPMEYRERDCVKRDGETPDGRATVTYDVPAGKTIRWLGLVIERPWQDRYAVYGDAPTPVYYPAVLTSSPEYMARVKHLHEAARTFHEAYARRMQWSPRGNIVQYGISWIQGYGGAFCTGRNCYYDYRRIAAFENPPVTDGSRLMGVYHEMAHCFQPEGLPDFLGGHTWTAFLTMQYDFDIFPNPAEVARRKAAGIKPNARYTEAYRLYRAMRAQELVPPLWYRWPESNPPAESFIRDAGWSEPLLTLRECAATRVMEMLTERFGDEMWGRLGRICDRNTILYEGLADPVIPQIAAALVSAAAGADLTAQLEELTDGRLAVTLDPPDTNLIRPEAWTLDAWQPTARLERVPSRAEAGGPALKLSCPTENDARLVQTVTVRPQTCYVITAAVRIADVPDSHAGVTVGVFNGPASLRLTGDRDWCRLGRVVHTGDSTELTVALRIGWASAPTTGTATFDDVQVVPLFSPAGWNALTR